MKSLGLWKGDLYTIDEFCELLDAGDINDYDGYGYYAIGEIESKNLVTCNSYIVRLFASVNGYTGIIWCNK